MGREIVTERGGEGKERKDKMRERQKKGREM